MQLPTLPALAMLLTSVALAAQQSVTSVSFDVPAPPEAVSASVDIYDADSWVDPDDLLGDDEHFDSSHFTGEVGDEDRRFQTGDLADELLECVGGEVAGGNGSSGESTAQVYLVITFHDEHGNEVGTHQTGYKPCSCL